MAQQFDPFSGQAGQYHADMSLFFKTDMAERSSGKQVMDSVRAFKRQRTWTVTNLSERLDNYENLVKSLQRHYQYFRLLVERNRKDTLSKTARDKFAQQLDICSAKLDSVLQQPIFAHLTPAAIKTHHLYPYRYLLSQAKTDARHSPDPSVEKIAGTNASQTLGRLTDGYDDLIDTIKPGKSMAASLHAYARHGEQFAATLINITRLKQSLAASQHYRSAPEQHYADRLQLSEDSVKTLYKKVAAVSSVLKAYQQLQQDMVRKKSGRDTVHSWELGLLSAYHWQPLLFSDTRQLVNNALKPLGANYQAHFARLLNPANGLLDIAYAGNRAGGGNSFGTAGTPIGLYMQRFDGGFQNTSTLIHEGGHAIHRQLMSENKVIPSYTSGPNFLSEAFAMLNELLLLDELEKQAKTAEERIYFNRLFADKLAREIFTSAEEGTFEQGLYDGVAAGKIRDLKDINELYKGIMISYDGFFPYETERETEWITKRLVFEDPLYNANYLFAILITCKLYQLHLDDPKGFAAKYHALLSNGFNEPAAISIKHYMGFELNYSNLLADAIKLMKVKTAGLKQAMQ